MTELNSEFGSLPPEHQAVLQLAQDQHDIEVTPLEKLAGGRTGAILYLASVLFLDSEELKHVVLKLDRARPGKDDEGDKHRLALREAPPEFGHEHLAELVFDKVETQDSLAIFYAVAGESLQRYRPLAAYKSQRHLEAFFGGASVDLLTGWNAAATFEQAVHPQRLLAGE